jgi:hypothetical protein
MDGIPRGSMSGRGLGVAILALAFVQLAVGCWMAFATRSFGRAVAPFHGSNVHDLRDFATFYLALGLALLIAAVRPSWRVQVLALATLEYAFHVVNHAIDVGHSDPGWVGPAELAAIAAATALFGWLARAAAVDKGRG